MGLISVVYDIFLYKINNPFIQSRYDKNINLFEATQVDTSIEKSSKIIKKLQQILCEKELGMIYKVYLSECDNCENLISSTLCDTIKKRTSIYQDFSDPRVLNMHKIVKSVNRESHRMEAFIRFKKIEENLFYAECTPDFDVLPLIEPHFRTRYADQKWIIYDLQRNYGLYYNLDATEQVKLIRHQTSNKIKDNSYEELWSTYFSQTNIPSRKNSKLFVQHVPKRYWKYLTEIT